MTASPTDRQNFWFSLRTILVPIAALGLIYAMEWAAITGIAAVVLEKAPWPDTLHYNWPIPIAFWFWARAVQLRATQDSWAAATLCTCLTVAALTSFAQGHVQLALMVMHMILLVLAALLLVAGQFGPPERRDRCLRAATLLFCVFGAALVAFYYQKFLTPAWRLGLTTAAIAAGLGIAVPWREMVWRAWRDKRAAMMGLGLAGVVWLYQGLHQWLWPVFCKLTAYVLEVMLWPLSEVKFEYARDNIVYITSPHYTVGVWPYCSGLDGIFLFLSLVTAMMLFDWPVFRRCRLWRFYLGLTAVVFYANVLRIGTLFLLGYAITAHLETSALAQYLGKMAVVSAFHSVAGFTFYLIAFGLCMTPVYRAAFKTRPD